MKKVEKLWKMQEKNTEIERRKEKELGKENSENTTREKWVCTQTIKRKDPRKKNTKVKKRNYHKTLELELSLKTKKI